MLFYTAVEMFLKKMRKAFNVISVRHLSQKVGAADYLTTGMHFGIVFCNTADFPVKIGVLNEC